jgi:hypothetical protein
MSARKQILTIIALLLALAAFAPASAGAAATPAWTIALNPLPANLAPGGKAQLLISASNVGAAPTSGQTEIEVHLPPEIDPLTVIAKGSNNAVQFKEDPSCEIEVATREVRCTTTESLTPNNKIKVEVVVETTGPARTADLQAAVSGGGTSQQATIDFPASVQAAPLPFGFLPGFDAPANGEDGSPAVLAGSHPYQQTIHFAFPTKLAGSELTNDGHPHEFSVELPRGMVGNPTTTPVLCTDAELTTEAGCPDASQIGLSEITTIFGEATFGAIFTGPLYNMVPPPGYPAELATDVAGVGLIAHLLVSVPSSDEYRIRTDVRDVLAFGQQPIFALQAQLWGDPSSPVHDNFRNSVAPSEIPFFTTPVECSGEPSEYGVSADSWEEPSPPAAKAETEYRSADLSGTPTLLSGCAALRFEPTVSALPTTNLADSPSGLEFDLRQPQEEPHPDPLGGRSTAVLKDARVTLPAGMSVNPSQAAGLAACSEEQIGYQGEDQGRLRFSESPQSCPDAAKLGTVEVTTPLLAEYTEGGTKLATDPETGDPIPYPLKGSVYLAKQGENPFSSLLAIYLVIEDARTGIVSKLAGKVEPDPTTGRLTTVFEENPELPLADIKLKLFGGARGALITPPTCGAHTTTADLVPWSAPETADAHPESSFQTTAEPGGGSCPTTESGQPDSPSFTAGTESAQAGAYSPFVLKLSREDGSQRLTGIDTTLAPGLLGKLAGIGECTDAQIARAEGRSRPEEGILERESPSCPASTQVGTVTVGVGAGPTPFYAQGHAYLAGPYKGAPLSLAVIVPAIAGAFDLGTVVTRVALHVEPETVQIHAVSDPLPTILDGIPLDIRSVALKMDRPDFTLNPTSCDPLAITGTATSALGQAAPLSERFQVGGCSALPFKPKLALRLKGKVRRTSHPTLIATLTARPGEANVAAAQVKLPHSVFLDQGHIKTVCTRVQWAADTCPAGSVYGSVEATSPLLGYPLAGSVYLRSSSHKLPDLVAKLQGPASQPVEIDLDGRTDSVKGALRNTFEAVPDAPVSRFRLELFGGKRGLIEMSSGFCQGRKAEVNLTGQNGKPFDTAPVVAAKCPKPKKHGKKAGHHKVRHGSKGKRGGK